MILQIERGSTRSQSVENSLWKGLWICSKDGCGMINLASKCNFLTHFQQRESFEDNLLWIIFARKRPKKSV